MIHEKRWVERDDRRGTPILVERRQAEITCDCCQTRAINVHFDERFYRWEVLQDEWTEDLQYDGTRLFSCNRLCRRHVLKKIAESALKQAVMISL